MTPLGGRVAAVLHQAWRRGHFLQLGPGKCICRPVWPGPWSPRWLQRRGPAYLPREGTDLAWGRGVAQGQNRRTSCRSPHPALRDFPRAWGSLNAGAANPCFTAVHLGPGGQAPARLAPVNLLGHGCAASGKEIKLRKNFQVGPTCGWGTAWHPPLPPPSAQALDCLLQGAACGGRVTLQDAARPPIPSLCRAMDSLVQHLKPLHPNSLPHPLSPGPSLHTDPSLPRKTLKHLRSCNFWGRAGMEN